MTVFAVDMFLDSNPQPDHCRLGARGFAYIDFVVLDCTPLAIN